MGFRVAVFLGFVLLLGGSLCFATQNGSLFNTNDTLHQVPQGQTMLAPSTGRQSNLTAVRRRTGSPTTFRLKTFQLRDPPRQEKPGKSDKEQMQTPEGPQGLQPRQYSPELHRTRPTAQEMLQLVNHGPDRLPVKKESKVVVKFEQRVATPAESVSVHCGEEKITIAVRQNFLGNGQLIRPGDLTLGGCAAAEVVDHVLLFQTQLHACDSTAMMTEDTLVYTFSLTYFPTAIGTTSVLKTNLAEVPVQCHYQRKHRVSSDAMRPAWKTFASDIQANQQLHFSLRLMTEDWQSRRPSNVYFLSDVMYIEASVLRGHHIPLRVFVDSCVATVNPDPTSKPRYPFITNYGCLTDAKLTGAQSYFTQRSQEDKLRFQLKTFKFHEDDRNSLYITCHLKATKVDVPIDSHNKACSFLTEARRWVASGGDNNVCSCCDTSCIGQRQRRSPAADAAPQWEETVVLGPILVEDNAELPPEPLPQLQMQGETHAASYSSAALLLGAGVALAVVLVFVSAVISGRHCKPTVYSVST
ncbi:zona pellucida sperm-binding protein 3-like [Cololabis saira]|uniref:zona pellucida sperm-binding protein 3-like n=1 Tax=Cololabis saira TaxID=129043 RepID=UPI002AD22F18|nr:zona pellucida sperm-binding protein 3-like [Cololabis saira]